MKSIAELREMINHINDGDESAKHIAYEKFAFELSLASFHLFAIADAANKLLIHPAVDEARRVGVLTVAKQGIEL